MQKNLLKHNLKGVDLVLIDFEKKIFLQHNVFFHRSVSPNTTDSSKVYLEPY